MLKKYSMEELKKMFEKSCRNLVSSELRMLDAAGDIFDNYEELMEDFAGTIENKLSLENNIAIVYNTWKEQEK